MKTFAFAAALIAASQAVELEWGYSQPSYSYKPQVSYSQAAPVKAASAAKGADYGRIQGSDFDAWGRDQDLSIDEGYGRTNAKSYAAESYDEWDNTNNDSNGAQAWGRDTDGYGKSSYNGAASKGSYAGQGYGAKANQGYSNGNSYGYAGAKGQGYGNEKMADASQSYGASQGGYDNDQWAKQAYAQDTDSRWGKSYDSVDAKNYDNEWYEKSVWADDDQWAEDYDRYDKQSGDSYGKAASTNNGSYGYGHGKQGGVDAASSAGAAGYWGKSASDFDAWGRDQDFKETVRYDNTRAKAYSAESYDEWDNQDNDKYGAQAWGKDRDVYGASSYGKDASSADYGSYGKQGAAYGAQGHHDSYGKSGYGGYGHGGYNNAQSSYGKSGQQGKDSVWKGASWEGAQQQAGYDNDQWAKQAYGQDYDSRWGKSYDSVSAKSYENESYDRELWADDDQWAEDYDRYDSRDAASQGNAASASYGKAGYGGYGAYGGYGKAASKAGAAGYDSRSGSDFDAWGRDQDLSVKESYDQTWAKSYEAESYDEWDNKDNDKYGSQGWGIDRDAQASSSYGKKASDGDYDAYGKAGQAYGQYGQSYGGYGSGYGHGYGHGKGYGGSSQGYAGAAYAGYGADKQQAASASSGAAAGAYDNDAWAKQAYGSDYDSRWGKSYDSVNAKSYDDEQYSRKVRADDDQWAEDFDRYSSKDADSYGRAASSEYQAPAQKHVSYAPVKSYGGYSGYSQPSYGSNHGYAGW